MAVGVGVGVGVVGGGGERVGGAPKDRPPLD